MFLQGARMQFWKGDKNDHFIRTEDELFRRARAKTTLAADELSAVTRSASLPHHPGTIGQY